MSQSNNDIECFCEECCENFWSYIAKDICPICEQINKKKIAAIPYEKIKKNNKRSEE